MTRSRDASRFRTARTKKWQRTALRERRGTELLTTEERSLAIVRDVMLGGETARLLVHAHVKPHFKRACFKRTSQHISATDFDFSTASTSGSFVRPVPAESM